MTREKRTLKKFLLEYATTFFRQYLAYCEQDAALFNNKAMSLEKLLAYQTSHKAGIMAIEYIDAFLERYNSHGDEDALIHWDGFICVPERLGSHSGTRVAVIIDEFQDMKFYVYNMSKELFSEMDFKGRLNGQGAISLPATYDRQAQSRKAPMLVCGSAVTLIFRTVMGGPLGGRFGFMYKTLSIPDGAALVLNTLKYYAPDKATTPELALYASTQVGGHPYYLYCLATSKCESKSFEDDKAIDRVIRYEIENGKIYGFWLTHFRENRKYLNADDDLELGKKIIYYFTQYNNQPVDIKAIAKKLKVPKPKVEDKLETTVSSGLGVSECRKILYLQ